MKRTSPRRRSPFLDAAEIADMPAAQQAIRRVFGQRPLAAPAAAPSASDDPRVFQASEEGSGAFGRWMLDAAGLPAYRYEIDQYKDPRARYPNSEGLDRRDHWHQIGNDRITGLASNDGTVQLYIADRGGTLLNHLEARADDEPRPGLLPGILGVLVRALTRWYRELRAHGIVQSWRTTLTPRGSPTVEAQTHQNPILGQASAPRRVDTRFAYAGGFGYLDDGAEVWATAFRYRPAGAEMRRVFGMGYYETETIYRNIRVIRRVYAPHGDDAVLLIDVRIENDGAAADLRYYEYWDVNVHQLKLQWTRTGLFAGAGDDERRELNGRFAPDIMWDAAGQALRFSQHPPDDAPPPDQPNEVDWSPADIFLAALSGPTAAQYTDKAAFFGDGGPCQPDALRARRDGEIGAPSTDSMPYCTVLRHDLRLAQGEAVELRYAYGAARPGQPLDFLARYRMAANDDGAAQDGQTSTSPQPDPLAHMLDGWKTRLAYFSTGDDPVVQREMAWHAYSLLSATVYNAYYDTHLVPQGSAYLYLHGVDGAPRDQALFTLPLVYLRPDLARDILRLIMSLTHADTGAITYAFGGYGIHSGALIHTNPSDLDLFFLLALSEYLAATGDLAFLDTEVSFYPRGVRVASVLEHVRVAVAHLIERVGIGEQGLIKIGDGDWSDGIVFETAMQDGPLGVSFLNSKNHGESVPNTQMALYVLPLAAALVEPRDQALAATIRALLPGLRAAVAAQWSGRWYNRAVLRDTFDRPVVVGDKGINLEAQPWALISGAAAEARVDAALIDAITALLDDPSPIGATLVEKGMVWPAVSQLLTWGYTRSRPDLAWRSLHRHTFAAHATAFPNVWFNIWSGPDGINGKDATNPGGSWASPVTPMTDFPVMNANQHAMALLGLLRVCGVEPAADGLIVAPQAPPERFVLDLPLLRLDVSPGRIAGEYRAVVTGSRVLHVRVPAGARGLAATVDSHPLNPSAVDAAEVTLPLSFEAGQAVPFEVRWQL